MINIIFVLIIMFNWYCELIDVQGAFLHGEFEKDRQVYMEVPQGFERFYPSNVYLLLLKTLYGTKQAATQFWKKLLQAFRLMKYQRSKADPCLYFERAEHGLVLCISWVDDILMAGKKEEVLDTKKRMMTHFDVDQVGELKEYIGCKIDHDREARTILITQPVLLQSYTDEFELPGGETPKTPAIPGQVLRKGENPEDNVSEAKQSIYRSGVGKLLHMMKRSRPEILNAVRELSKFMSTGASEIHMVAMYRLMKYLVGMPKRGLLLNPVGECENDPNFKFTIAGLSDSDYAKDPERRRSVSGYSTFLNEAAVTMKSRMQGCVTLSVTEAEYVSGTHCVQDMLFLMRVLQSIGLMVFLPMILYIDNKGAVDLANNWSVGGRTRHVDTRHHFLRELKELGILKIVWLSNEDMTSDLFTKNLPGKLFEKHASRFCGNDEYMG